MVDGGENDDDDDDGYDDVSRREWSPFRPFPFPCNASNSFVLRKNDYF